MGREIRRVPPHWEHPRDENGEYKPMHDKAYDDAAQEWLNGLAAWNQKSDEEKNGWKYFWEYEGNPPDENYYRPKFTEAPTWYQVYQTVSEGTPVTPAFATREELIDYLVEHGDFWDQKRGRGGYTREAATAFVDLGWTPSFVVNHRVLISGIEAAGQIKTI